MQAARKNITILLYVVAFAIALRMFVEGDHADAYTFLVGAFLLVACARFGGAR
jgi:hypothetical protein